MPVKHVLALAALGLAGCGGGTVATDEISAGQVIADADACEPALESLSSGLQPGTKVELLKSETLPVSRATDFYSGLFGMDPASTAIPTSGMDPSATGTVCVIIGDNFGDIHTPPPNPANPTITFPSNFYTAAQYFVAEGKAVQVTIGFNDTSNPKATVLVLPREFESSSPTGPGSSVQR